MHMLGLGVLPIDAVDAERRYSGRFVTNTWHWQEEGKRVKSQIYIAVLPFGCQQSHGRVSEDFGAGRLNASQTAAPWTHFDLRRVRGFACSQPPVSRLIRYLVSSIYTRLSRLRS